MSEPFDLIIFCPLPPVRSGIADYLYEQLPHFPKNWHIALVVDQSEWHDISNQNSCRVLKLRDYRKQRAAYTTTPKLYHLGNNSHHIFVFEELLLSPGTIVLHDVCQHHMIVEYTLARGNRKAYRDFLFQELGEFGFTIADNRQKGIWNDLTTFLVQLNTPALNAATNIIVHSEWAKMQVSNKVPGKPVCAIPHHYLNKEKTSSNGRTTARTLLGINSNELVYLALGFVTPPKQIELTLKALSNIADQLPDFCFYIVGELHDKNKLYSDILEAGLGSKTKVTGYVSIEEMESHIRAADIIVNLRYPTAGETSGTLVRALGEGRCAVVFNYAAFADYPDDVVYKLPLDTSNTVHLEHALLDLAMDRESRLEKEEYARDYIREQHKIDTCVDQYIKFLIENENVR